MVGRNDIDPPQPSPLPPRRAGFTRRAFIGTCAGIGAAAASIWLWRLRWRPGSAEIVMPPLDVEDEPVIAPFVHPPVPSVEPVVRVRVHRARHERNPVLFGEDGQWVRISQGQDTIALATAALRAPLSVRMGTMGWVVTDSMGFSSQVAGVEPFVVRPDETPIDDANAGKDRAEIQLENRRFPGSLRFVSRSDIAPAAFDIVNDLPLEDYLPGVVVRELYNHWHYEAHAAQAIAARSFACAEHAHFLNRRHFDLTDDQSSQVYGGATTHRTSLDAVADTRGQVLAYDNLLVPGYYSSCCGGTAATAPDAIGPNPVNTIAPLLGQSEPDICSSAPVCTWRAQRPIEMSTRRIVAWANARGHSELADLKTLASIEPVAHNDHGRPTRYEVTDVDGTAVQVSAERLRFALNHFEPGLPRPARALRSSHLTATFQGEDILFEGHGFGHGVGMCQHGAQIRARLGADHREILAWYYPEAEIVTAYE